MVAKRIVSANEFSEDNRYQDLTLYFKKTSTEDVSYSVYSYQSVDVTVDSIKVTDLGADNNFSKTYEAENYSIMTGEVVDDGGATAVKSSATSRFAALLSWSVNSLEQRSGDFKAEFYLKVADNTQNQKIGRIEVYDRSTGAFLYTEFIYADDARFTDTTEYHVFETPSFTTGADAVVDYRVKFYSVPDLYYDKVVVSGV